MYLLSTNIQINKQKRQSNAYFYYLTIVNELLAWETIF